MARRRAKRYTRYWWNKKFKQYEAEYNKLQIEGYNERFGYEKIDTLKEFKQAYITTTEEDRLRGRKRSSNMAKKLAEDSFFELSRAEAKAIRNYFKELEDETQAEELKDITSAKIKDIQAGAFDRQSTEFYEFIREERARLFASGKSAEEVRKTISNVYFGSK